MERLTGRDVDLYTLSNGNDIVAKVATYGATLVGLEAPDRDGKLADVVLGFDDLDGYLAGTQYFGSTVGRVANRIRNGAFELDGRRFAVATNNGTHHLHGGVKGWDKVVWTAEAMDTAEGPALRLAYVSRDGEEGYPGVVAASCLYTLTWKNELRVAMRATTDAATLVAMAHHSYWNLGGQDAGPITDHELTLLAQAYTPGDPLVPTGEVAEVSGTPFDFTHAETDRAGSGRRRRRARRLRSQLRRRRRAPGPASGGSAGRSEERPGPHDRGRPARACSSIRATTSTAPSGAKAESPIPGTAGFAWRRRRSRTRSTSPPGATR